MKRYIPDFFKAIIRFFWYKNERRKVVREFSIRKNQNKLLNQHYSKDTRKLIIFIVRGASWYTGEDKISGGILSIASIYEETEKLKSIHGAKSIMLTPPKAHLLQKHKQFPNDIPVFRFSQLQHFSELREVLIHIPEYMFKTSLVEKIFEAINYLNPEQIHLNILNQRIDIMPSPEIINKIKKQGFKITQTTAHERYSTFIFREKFGIPLHKLSVYATPERYSFTSHHEKENLILISPDKAEHKSAVLKKIAKELPHFRMEIIENITYLAYLELIKKAKYMLTFGEGLDFYFIETIFSGGVSFAVYNTDFFTEPFKDIDGVFDDEKTMEDNIVKHIQSLEKDTKSYKSTNRAQFEKCHAIYNETHYKNNLVNFYKGEYLYP